jgi:hypothetical protein
MVELATRLTTWCSGASRGATADCPPRRSAKPEDRCGAVTLAAVLGARHRRPCSFSRCRSCGVWGEGSRNHRADEEARRAIQGPAVFCARSTAGRACARSAAEPACARGAAWGGPRTLGVVRGRATRGRDGGQGARALWAAAYGAAVAARMPHNPRGGGAREAGGIPPGKGPSSQARSVMRRVRAAASARNPP